MNTGPNLFERQRRCIHSLIAAAAVAVIVVSGIGVAALAGVLPASKAAPVVTTASPLVDTQIADPLSGLKLNARLETGLAVGPRAGVTGAR
jgi:hypothetical protein